MFTRNRILLVSLLTLTVGSCLFSVAGDAAADTNRGRTIIVKYLASGPHAVHQCAEALSTSGKPFEGSTQDRSDSLDQIFRRHRVGIQRAIFRSATAEPLEVQRAEMLARWRSRGAAIDASKASRVADLADIYRFRAHPEASVPQLIAELRADPHVEYVAIDRLVELDAEPLPNDPFLATSGSWGQDFPDLWGIYNIRAHEVWERSRGRGQIVAVVDTGLDEAHPDIIGNVWVNPGEDLNRNGVAEPSDRNGVDDDGNGFIDDLTGFDFANSVDADEDGFFDGPDDISDSDPFDDNGHGSHVSGTIAAVGDNGIGIIGVAPEAKLMVLKGFSATGGSSDSVLWRAVLYAAEMGASVINNSWSCGAACPENLLAEDVLEVVDALGAVVVTSAGNSSVDVIFRSPENGRRAISVGALSVDEGLASFSNRGFLMDIVAPGGEPNAPNSILVARRNILSLFSSGAPDTNEPFAVEEDYFRFAGTSMAAPHVTGAVAILRSLRPELRPFEVRRLLRMSARDLGEPHHDPVFGAGALDVARLVDTKLPALEFEIEGPRAGTLLDPAEGFFEFPGRASGSDLASLAVEIGVGLTPSEFIPIERFGNSMSIADPAANLGEGVLARWDLTEGVENGPHVFRVRAVVDDGHVIDEHAIVGVERISPIEIAASENGRGRPTVSGRNVVWVIDDDENSPLDHDLEIGQFPSGRRGGEGRGRKTARLFELEGNQISPLLSGSEVAWRVRNGPETTLQRCRLVGQSRHCDPAPVSEAPGNYFASAIGPEWLVWTRFDETTRLEGCRIGAHVEACEPRSLLAPEEQQDWTLTSYDGETLLVRRGGFTTQARCRLTSAEEYCEPQAITFAPGSTGGLKVKHSGPLMVFKSVGNFILLPPGCEEIDPSIGCSPIGQKSGSRLHACYLDDESSTCDPVPITPVASLEQLENFDVSGRRIVWSYGAPEERVAIHYCEFVPELRECVDQRISGATAIADRPRIDGHRIVWEDHRTGTASIFGIEVPRQFVPERLDLTPGSSFQFLISGVAGRNGGLRFEISGIEGISPSDAHVSIQSNGRGGRKAIVRGRMPAHAAGKSLWRVRATDEAGLFTEQVVEVIIGDRIRAGSSGQKSRGGGRRSH